MSIDTKKRFPMPGVEIWENPKNKFVVFQLHFTANEKKRDGSYREEMKNSMPIKQYLQEYEIQWETYAGSPVYPDWNPAIHGSTAQLSPQPGLPLIIGIDNGLTPAAIICQLQEQTLYVLKEITAVNMGAERFMNMVSQDLAIEWPYWRDFKKNWICFVDPSGFFRKDTDEGTCAEIITSTGFSPIPGEIAFEARRTSVEHFLLRTTKGKTNLLVDLTRCPMLARGFGGGYMYAESAFDIEPNKARPVKNEFSHVHDALQYVCSGIVHKSSSKRSSQIPKLSYGFVGQGNSRAKR